MQTDFHDRLRLVTSRQNNLVKDLRQAFTQAELTEDGHCAIEGVHILEEAIRSGLRVKAVFFSQSAEQRASRLMPQLSAQTETILLPDDVFKSAVPSDTPQGVAALIKPRTSKLEELLAADSPLIIGAAGLQDPGNLGTMIRSAEAFGATGVLTLEKTVSTLNPKVIRGSAGSIFRLPVVKGNSTVTIAMLKSSGVRIAATSSHKGRPLPEVDLQKPICVFIGSEGQGVPKELLANIDETIVIPHSPKVESLNAGIAASLILYEAARQRAKS
jgi:RNA methyltransferase, TrmH family